MTSEVLIILAAALGVMLTVAGVVGVWLAMRTSQNSQTLKNFRDASASWREKADALASDLATMQTEMAHLQAQYNSLLSEHEVLKNVVTGKSAVEALATQMSAYKDEVISEIRVNRTTLEQLIGGPGNAAAATA